jgi:hypothetical protein
MYCSAVIFNFHYLCVWCDFFFCVREYVCVLYTARGLFVSSTPYAFFHAIPLLYLQTCELRSRTVPIVCG